jgi:hypothetical protein
MSEKNDAYPSPFFHALFGACGCTLRRLEVWEVDVLPRDFLELLTISLPLLEYLSIEILNDFEFCPSEITLDFLHTLIVRQQEGKSQLVQWNVRQLVRLKCLGIWGYDHHLGTLKAFPASIKSLDLLSCNIYRPIPNPETILGYYPSLEVVSLPASGDTDMWHSIQKCCYPTLRQFRVSLRGYFEITQQTVQHYDRVFTALTNRRTFPSLAIVCLEFRNDNDGVEVEKCWRAWMVKFDSLQIQV